MFIYAYVRTHKPALAVKERKRRTECAERLEVSAQRGPRAGPGAGNAQVAGEDMKDFASSGGYA